MAAEKAKGIVATAAPLEGDPMEAHTHAHAEHHKTGHRLIDIGVSLCALLISAVSIVMAYHTGHPHCRIPK